MDVLRDALRRGDVRADELDRAGRFVLTRLREAPEPPGLTIRLLGQCTTSWLGPALAAIAWGHGISCVVHEGGYDTVAQDVAGLDANRTTQSEVLILLPWHQRLLAPGDRSPASRVDDELAFWRAVWARAAEHRVARIIQVSYDWVSAGPGGHLLAAQPGGVIHMISGLNDAMRQALPSSAHFLSLEAVSGVMGRDRFYDARRYFWTKQPFSEAGVQLLAEHLFAAVRAATVGPKKALVVDLDNTLWGGLVGEVGPQGISLGDTPDGEAYTAFQVHLKALAQRGILLVACSKNNLRDAQEPFRTNANMILTLDDFAAFEASWGPKSAALERVAAKLALGLDSMVFFDDNAAEQELVRQTHPEVAVVNVPSDPAEYVRALERGLWFESVALTPEDAVRSSQYAAEARRREDPARSGSMDDYLRSLEMIGEVRPIADADLARVVQLLGKTNQFNLTTRRHAVEHVRELLSREGAFGLTLRLRDRFGEHGLVAVALCVPVQPRDADAPTILIDSFLMSCRVIGRTAEHLLMRELILEARRRGYSRVAGEYVATPKNPLVARFYEDMAFVRVEDGELQSVPSGVRYVRSTDGQLPATAVRAPE